MVSVSVCRLYVSLDSYICANLLVMNLLFSLAMLKVLADPSSLAHTWHIHLSVVLNLVACVAHLALINR